MFFLKVHGNIGVALSKSFFILDVLMRKTRVSGDLSVFESCLRVQNVSLSRTLVSGSVGHFSGCHALRILALDFCSGVVGDRSELERALPLCAVDF